MPDCSADLPSLPGQGLAETLQEIGQFAEMPKLSTTLARRHLTAAVCLTQGTDATQCTFMATEVTNKNHSHDNSENSIMTTLVDIEDKKQHCLS